MHFSLPLLTLLASAVARPHVYLTERNNGGGGGGGDKGGGSNDVQAPTNQHYAYQSYFDSNAARATIINNENPHVFAKLALGQAPDLLWIGCGDSRVPETVILAREPGDVFTHRNIAGQFQPDDANANAVLEYAVADAGVSHVAVVGHQSCGGCKAAMAANGTDDSTLLGKFLKPLIELKESINDVTLDKLIVANVQAGVDNIAKSPTMKTAWGAGKNVSIHGWLYHLDSGKLEDLGMTKTGN